MDLLQWNTIKTSTVCWLMSGSSTANYHQDNYCNRLSNVGGYTYTWITVDTLTACCRVQPKCVIANGESRCSCFCRTFCLSVCESMRVRFEALIKRTILAKTCPNWAFISRAVRLARHCPIFTVHSMEIWFLGAIECRQNTYAALVKTVLSLGFWLKFPPCDKFQWHRGFL